MDEKVMFIVCNNSTYWGSEVYGVFDTLEKAVDVVNGMTAKESESAGNNSQWTVEAVPFNRLKKDGESIDIGSMLDKLEEKHNG